jgi:hypothetical protein
MRTPLLSTPSRRVQTFIPTSSGISEQNLTSELLWVTNKKILARVADLAEKACQ